MSIVKRYRVSFTMIGIVAVDIGIEDEEETGGYLAFESLHEAHAAELAEGALKSLELEYPGVVDFTILSSDVVEVNEVK